MIKRTIEVSQNSTYIKLKDEQLVFVREGSDVGSVPVEDLGVLILDAPGICCTQAALDAAVCAGAVVIVCGADHHPSGYLLPVAGNQLHTEHLRAQLDSGQALVKRLWQQIIKTKLANQAALLPKDSREHGRLKKLSESVKSDDSENCEGQGARIYWQALFGKKFKREREGLPPNNLLNYGYMVVRAATARAVCAAGLHPAIGLHHHHRNNPFCLADDMMEAYRPFVDIRVLEMWRNLRLDINRETKAELLAVLTDEVILLSGKGPLFVALQKSCASLYRCLTGEDAKLDLPKL